MLKRIIKGILRRPIRVVNSLIKKSFWYQGLFLNANCNEYPRAAWYRKNFDRNYDFMVLGSSMSFWGVDVSSMFPLRGLKLSRASQTLTNDYRLLKNYFSIIRHNGTVLFLLSPFSSVNVEEKPRDLMRYLKAYENLSSMVRPELLNQAQRLADNPILMGIPALKSGLRVLLGRDRAPIHDNRPDLETNTMSPKELEEDAKHWIDGWLRQFHISDIEYPLTEENVMGREYRLSILKKMIDFCRERDLRPVILYLPVSRYLNKYFTPKVRDVYIDSFLQSVDRDVEIYNYFGDKDFLDESLYFNSFFLNKRGRKLFTEKMIKDVFR